MYSAHSSYFHMSRLILDTSLNLLTPVQVVNVTGHGMLIHTMMLLWNILDYSIDHNIIMQFSLSVCVSYSI